MANIPGRKKVVAGLATALAHLSTELAHACISQCPNAILVQGWVISETQFLLFARLGAS